MNNGYQTPREAITALRNDFSPLAIARHLGIHDAHVYRALHGDITPTLVNALRKKGYIPPPKRRVRFAADVPPELREAITECARERNMTNGELLALMWERWGDRGL